MTLPDPPWKGMCKEDYEEHLNGAGRRRHIPFCDDEDRPCDEEPDPDIARDQMMDMRDEEAV